MYTHILVPLDGSALAEQVLPHVEALALKFGARVTLVRATTPVEKIIAETSANLQTTVDARIDPWPIVKAEQDEAERYLSGVAKRLSGQNIPVEYQHPEDLPSQAIVNLAREQKADLIAMTTHGRTGLKRLFLGSVASAVLHKAPCPVLLVRVHEGKDKA